MRTAPKPRKPEPPLVLAGPPLFMRMEYMHRAAGPRKVESRGGGVGDCLFNSNYPTAQDSALSSCLVFVCMAWWPARTLQWGRTIGKAYRPFTLEKPLNSLMHSLEYHVISRTSRL